MFNTPILFLIFKRPDVTAQVFEAIRLAQPAKLYIAADGARPDKAGEADKVAPEKDVNGLVEKLKTQKGILITHKTVSGANHFFNGQTETLMAECEDYLDRRLAGELTPEPAAKRIR